MDTLSETVSFLGPQETKARLVAQALLERRSQAMVARIALETYLDDQAAKQAPQDDSE